MRNFTKLILIALLTFSITFIKAQTVSTVAAGSWSEGTTWSGGAVPTSNANIEIMHAVTISNDVQCNNLKVTDAAGNLTVNIDKKLTAKGVMTIDPNCKTTVLGELVVENNLNVLGELAINNEGRSMTVGKSGFNNNSLSIENGATLNITSGVLAVLGNAVIKNGSTFTIAGGDFFFDGNLNDGTGVAAGTPILKFETGSTTAITGGSITFYDTHPSFGDMMIDGTVDLTNCAVYIGNEQATDDTPFSFGDNITFGELIINYPTQDNNFVSFGLNNIINGNLSMSNGKVLVTEGSKFKGNINVGAGSIIEGELVCIGMPTNIVSTGGDLSQTKIVTLSSFSDSYVKIGTNLTVKDVDLGRNIELTGFDLMSGEETGTQLTVTGIITEYGGRVLLMHANAALKINIGVNVTKTFPIASDIANSLPVTIKNMSMTDLTWSVGLKAVENAPAGAQVVLFQWNITPSVLAGANADITVKWSDTDEDAGFVLNNANLYHWNGSTWDNITQQSSNTTREITKMGWGSFSPFAIFSQVALPVELLSFTGKSQVGKAVLSWQTASEKNNAGFEVEKSFDGKTFEKIGFVKGMGNTAIKQNYTFTDISFTQNAYYRLKQVDNNGAFDYSKTIALSTTATKAMAVKAYPNPVADVLTVETALSELAQLEIIDALGRVISKQNVESGSYQIPMANLTRGIYILRVSTKNDISIQKIVKQ